MTLADRLMISVQPHLTDDQYEAVYERLKAVYGDQSHGERVDTDEVLRHLKDVGVELKVSLAF